MRNNVVPEDFEAYLKLNYKVIPVGESLKSQGKRPLVENYLDLPWEDYDDPMDLVNHWFSRLGDKITGLGLVMGPTSNNICCIDIDTEDDEIIEKIVKFFHSPFKKRGGKGLSLFFQSDGKNARSYYDIKCPGNLGHVEVFYDKRMIVMPPSWYEGDKNYVWLDSTVNFLDCDPDDLPVLNSFHVEKLGELIGSASAKSLNINLAKNQQFKDGLNRTIAINSIAGRLLKDNSEPNINDIASELISYDAKHFHDNSFFLDPRKAHNKTNNKTVNVMGYLHSIMSTVQNNTGGIVDYMSPLEVSGITFRPLRPVIERPENAYEGMPIFDKGLIPSAWRSMIEELHLAQGAPHQGIYMSMLTAMGACLQGNTKIQPIPSNPFFKRTNMAVAMVATSGSKKSDIVNNAVRELVKIDRGLKSINSRELLTKIEDLTSKIEMLTKEKKKAGADVDAINAEIYKNQDELDGNQTKGTKFLYENAPIQKMILDAKRNQETGLLLLKDEMKQIFADFRKKGNEDARTFYMKGLDGNQSFSYSTISRGDDVIDDFFISLLTNVQPDVISAYIRSLSGPYGENDGFLQRIILVPFGDPIATKPIQIDYTKFTKQYEHYNRAFHSEKITAHIDPEWIEYYNDLIFQIRANAIKYSHIPVGSFLSKHEGMLCSIAYLYEFMEAKEGNKPKLIGKYGLDMAMRLLLYLGECAKFLFNIKDQDLDHKNLTEVAELFRIRFFKDEITQSEAYQQMRHSIKFPGTFYHVLKELELRGYIYLDKKRQNSMIVHVNPDVYLL